MNPHIFKAYDVRGLYPAELDEQIFHQIGRAFVAYLKAKRIGVGRDKVRIDQREIGIVQPAQQIIERPPTGRILLSRNH